MSYENKEDEFNQNNIIMVVKKVPKISPSFTFINELNELINQMEWNKVMERVTQKHKVRILSNNNNESNEENLPLEVECPMSNGDMPLFNCLRNEQVPLEVIKVMTGECVCTSINRK